MWFGRDLSLDQMVEMAINDLKNANRMGCNVIREQYLLPPEGQVKLYPQMQSIITATDIKGATTRERSYVDVTNFYK